MRPHFAELAHTFNAELLRQTDALMQSLDAMQALMTREQQGQVAQAAVGTQPVSP